MPRFTLIAALLFICLITNGQTSGSMLSLSPEQEAAKQTEKLQRDVNLNQEQTKIVYNINLKYARQRQISNTRAEAVERIRNKTAEIQSVLNDYQKGVLQLKRSTPPSHDEH